METPTKRLLLLREKATVWCIVGGNDNNWWCSIAASFKELHPTSTAIYRILWTSSEKAIFKEKGMDTRLQSLQSQAVRGYGNN